MMTKMFRFLFLFFPILAFAQNPVVNDNFKFTTTEEFLNTYTNARPTHCASKLFAEALRKHANEISEYDTEEAVQNWAKTAMHDPNILQKVLKCPELNVDDTTTVVFTPITYTFPSNNRTITINYSTQPKVLKQHLILATKPSLPTGDVSPKLMDPDDPAKYLNTEPAWYAIMVVQHDSLSDFVGPEKNNTVSVKYIDDNISKIYPRGYHCTSKSAITLGNNYDTINKVVRKVVDLEDDPNDYYIAGDVNLEWVMYAEIAVDVIITVVTCGGGAVATGALKGVRATRTSKNLIKSLKVLTKMDDVQDYLKVTRQIAKHSDDIAKIEKNIANADKYERALKKAEKLRKAGKDATKYEKEAEEILKAAQKVDPKMTSQTLKDVDKLKDQEKTLKDALKTSEQQAKNIENSSKNVQLYKQQSEALTDVMKYRRGLRAWRRPQTGNVIVRNLKKIGKTIKSARSGVQTLDKTARAARAGMSARSAKMGDWLFQTTMKYGSRLARFESKVGGIYGVVSFLGDMYDKTSATSKEFSNGIDFKPLCLLFEGQENVVNYGMWLMWVGNSTDPADDDAAYLQAMDFAAKFYYQLDEYQDEHGAECNVDIYVVRPIIRLDERNVDDPKGEMFYLFMNEIPWTTADQFGAQHTNIEDWERTQKKLENEDPDGKYGIPEQNKNPAIPQPE